MSGRSHSYQRMPLIPLIALRALHGALFGAALTCQRAAIVSWWLSVSLFRRAIGMLSGAVIRGWRTARRGMTHPTASTSPSSALSSAPDASAAAGSAMATPTLYRHQPHPHTPRNVNDRHSAERQAQVAAHTTVWRQRLAGLNMALAVWLTKHTGSMACAWLFGGIGIGSLIGVFTNNVFLAALCGSISSYFLQLVLLPVLAVGSNVLSRHAELQADEQFASTQRTLHESEQMVQHLNAQDAELLRQTDLLLWLVQQQQGATQPETQGEALSTAPTPAPSASTRPKKARA